jgi:hypothetical protein
MVSTGYIVLTPVRPGFVVTVILRDHHPQDLAPATGAPGLHAFAVRVGIARLAIPSRPSHPASHVRDDREAPLGWRRDGREIEWIPIFSKYASLRQINATGNVSFMARMWRSLRLSSLPLPPFPDEADERGERCRRLVAARIIQERSGKRRAPVVEQADQRA